MNTRQDDLDKLEELRAKHPRGGAHLTPMLDKLYRQSKNMELEKARQAMIRAENEGNFAEANRIADKIRQMGR